MLLSPACASFDQYADYEARGEHFRALVEGGGDYGASKPRPMHGRKQQQPLEHRLLLTATLCLLAGGAVMVYSASSARTLLQGDGDGTAYLVKYLVYGASGSC